MVTIEQLAQTALDGDSLTLRSLTQDFLRTRPRLNEYPPPDTHNHRLLAVSAALIELFALRLGQTPPSWANSVGAMPEPTFLVKAAATMKHLRALCESESPDPLRKRNIFAPPNFLEFA